MYLVYIPIDTGHDLYVFLWVDPRPQRCTYRVTEGVDLIDLAPHTEEWRLKPDTMPHVLSRSTRAPTKFKAFRSELDVPNSWEILDGSAEVWNTWEAFMSARPE